MNKLTIGRLFSYFVFCVSFFIIIALSVHCKGYFKQCAVLISAAIIPAALLFCTGKRRRTLCKYGNYILVPSAILIITICSGWERWGQYDAPVIERPQSYQMGKVLVLVPHQDDEVNCVGGIMGELAKYGELYIVFATNGSSEVRLNEAIRGAALYGIHEEHILCMGYGQQLQKNTGKQILNQIWGDSYTHVYNLPADEIAADGICKTGTWGIKGIPEIIPGTNYTRHNFKRDLSAVIRKLKPDTIICIDYDMHPDHRALSLLFEEVICDLMKKESSYSPFILKSFAYSTSWLAPMDFYADNLLSTKNTWNQPYMPETNCYNWENRLRLPVCNNALSRVLPGNIIRDSFMENLSQLSNSPGMENAIVSSDRVFWWRPTGNLLLTADVVAAGQNVSHLTDFKLYDSHDVGNMTVKPLAHGWIPLKEHETVKFKLQNPSVIDEIRLYDQNDINNQIVSLSITLSNGKKIKVENLPANGAAKVVKTNCSEPLLGFDLQIHKTTGLNAGLAEVEAFASAPVPPVKVAKLKDAHDNFMYDYTVEPEGTVDFSLYTWPQIDGADYQAHLISDEGKRVLKPNAGSCTYRVTVQKNSQVMLEITDANGKIVDAVRLQNPPRHIRKWRRLQQSLDSIMKDFAYTAQVRFYRNLLRFLSTMI